MFLLFSYRVKLFLNYIFFNRFDENIKIFYIKKIGVNPILLKMRMRKSNRLLRYLQGGTMTVTVDEKARAFLAKHNESSVYTYLGGCRT